MSNYVIGNQNVDVSMSELSVSGGIGAPTPTIHHSPIEGENKVCAVAGNRLTPAACASERRASGTFPDEVIDVPIKDVLEKGSKSIDYLGEDPRISGSTISSSSAVCGHSGIGLKSDPSEHVSEVSTKSPGQSSGENTASILSSETRTATTSLISTYSLEDAQTCTYAMSLLKTTTGAHARGINQDDTSLEKEDASAILLQTNAGSGNAMEVDGNGSDGMDPQAQGAMIKASAYGLHREEVSAASDTENKHRSTTEDPIATSPGTSPLISNQKPECDAAPTMEAMALAKMAMGVEVESRESSTSNSNAENAKHSPLASDAPTMMLPSEGRILAAVPTPLYTVATAPTITASTTPSRYVPAAPITTRSLTPTVALTVNPSTPPSHVHRLHAGVSPTAGRALSAHHPPEVLMGTTIATRDLSSNLPLLSEHATPGNWVSGSPRVTSIPVDVTESRDTVLRAAARDVGYCPSTPRTLSPIPNRSTTPLLSARSSGTNLDLLQRSGYKSRTPRSVPVSSDILSSPRSEWKLPLYASGGSQSTRNIDTSSHGNGTHSLPATPTRVRHTSSSPLGHTIVSTASISSAPTSPTIRSLARIQSDHAAHCTQRKSQSEDMALNVAHRETHSSNNLIDERENHSVVKSKALEEKKDAASNEAPAMASPPAGAIASTSSGKPFSFPAPLPEDCFLSGSFECLLSFRGTGDAVHPHALSLSPEDPIRCLPPQTSLPLRLASAFEEARGKGSPPTRRPGSGAVASITPRSLGYTLMNSLQNASERSVLQSRYRSALSSHEMLGSLEDASHSPHSPVLARWLGRPDRFLSMLSGMSMEGGPESARDFGLFSSRRAEGRRVAVPGVPFGGSASGGASSASGPEAWAAPLSDGVANLFQEFPVADTAHMVNSPMNIDRTNLASSLQLWNGSPISPLSPEKLLARYSNRHTTNDSNNKILRRDGARGRDYPTLPILSPSTYVSPPSLDLPFAQPTNTATASNNTQKKRKRGRAASQEDRRMHLDTGLSIPLKTDSSSIIVPNVKEATSIPLLLHSRLRLSPIQQLLLSSMPEPFVASLSKPGGESTAIQIIDLLLQCLVEDQVITAQNVKSPGQGTDLSGVQSGSVHGTIQHEEIHASIEQMPTREVEPIIEFPREVVERVQKGFDQVLRGWNCTSLNEVLTLANSKGTTNVSGANAHLLTTSHDAVVQVCTSHSKVLGQILELLQKMAAQQEKWLLDFGDANRNALYSRNVSGSSCIPIKAGTFGNTLRLKSSASTGVRNVGAPTGDSGISLFPEERFLSQCGDSNESTRWTGLAGSTAGKEPLTSHYSTNDMTQAKHTAHQSGSRYVDSSESASANNTGSKYDCIKEEDHPMKEQGGPGMENQVTKRGTNEKLSGRSIPELMECIAKIHGEAVAARVRSAASLSNKEERAKALQQVLADVYGTVHNSSNSMEVSWNDEKRRKDQRTGETSHTSAAQETHASVESRGPYGRHASGALVINSHHSSLDSASSNIISNSTSKLSSASSKMHSSSSAHLSLTGPSDTIPNTSLLPLGQQLWDTSFSPNLTSSENANSVSGMATGLPIQGSGARKSLPSFSAGASQGGYSASSLYTFPSSNTSLSTLPPLSSFSSQEKPLASLLGNNSSNTLFLPPSKSNPNSLPAPAPGRSDAAQKELSSLLFPPVSTSDQVPTNLSFLHLSQQPTQHAIPREAFHDSILSLMHPANMTNSRVADKQTRRADCFGGEDGSKLCVWSSDEAWPLGRLYGETETTQKNLITQSLNGSGASTSLGGVEGSMNRLFGNAEVRADCSASSKELFEYVIKNYSPFSLVEESINAPVSGAFRFIGVYSVTQDEVRHPGTRQKRMMLWLQKRRERNWSKESLVRYPHRAGVVARRTREQGRFS